MKELLEDGFEEFLHCYDYAPYKGLRFNTKKVRKETVEMLVSEWDLHPVSWCTNGYYYDQARPGLSPYHDAGVFYIQEPSAMCVAEAADISENDLVLDLCAAPGGKSTAASEKCFALLSNEIIPNRARILSSNIERMGIVNAVVSSASPERLSDVFPGYFDVVICDAPCSGEGMMRKDDTAISEWSPENVKLCIERQSMILDYASATVRPGGKLIYSTCTFEKGENEEQILGFLRAHPEFKVLSMNRIWPHRDKGEGHFFCLLSNGEFKPSVCRSHSELETTLHSMEKRLSNAGIHILRTGLQKGESFKDKKSQMIYEPSHAEIMASVFVNCTNGVNLKTKELALSFLEGNVLRINDEESEIKGKDGFVGVYFDGYPLGLGKRSGNVIKNHLPKGLRRI